MRAIFVGFLFIFFNLNITAGDSVIGLIPNFVGYILLVRGIKELENEIEQDTQDLQAKKERLEHLIEIRKRNDANVELMREAMTTVFNIVQSNGEISHEQIDFIAGSKKMTREALIKEIKKNKFKIVKYTKGERERRLKDVKI